VIKASDLGKDQKRDELLTRRVALMIAAAKSDAEITKALGISPGVLKILKGSPLFEQLIAAYSREIEERGINDIVAELDADAPKNIDFIKRVRDGNFDDTKDRMQLRLAAAKMLFDKQAPDANQRAAAQQAARIIIDGRMLGQALRALKNVGVLDIPAEAIENATASTLPRLFGKTPEEFAEEYAAAEAAALDDENDAEGEA
jgi:hypothetical protein